MFSLCVVVSSRKSLVRFIFYITTVKIENKINQLGEYEVYYTL